MTNADKRPVTTDALETLGTIIPEGSGRDAIHLAVEPAIAAHQLRPGNDVGFVEGGVGACDEPVGIVDPFLKGVVRKGQRFWLVVYPRQITSLRHVWTHPKFPEAATAHEPVSKVQSEAWLREFVASADCPDYETVLAAAVNNDDPEYLHFNDVEAHGEIPPEFWHHVEIVTGRKINQHATYFSCSC